MRFVTAVVTAVLEERAGLQRVDTDHGRAYALTALTGPVAAGDRVVLNTTAVDLGLGTGGWHVVHWNLARDAWSSPGGGHLVKLRYTSLQVDAGGAEEHHGDALAASADALAGVPVVACSVHSQLAPVAAAFAAGAPGRRLVLVQTDGAALPVALSDLVHDLRARGLLAATVTAGHAFGGDHEAVTVPSALLVARRVAGADAVVVAMGPGVVGSGTALGTTAVEVAAVLDAAAALGATPVAAVRASSGDVRARHRGLSHHSATTLGLLVRSRVVVPVPDGEAGEALAAALAEAGAGAARHEVVRVAVPDPVGLLAGHGLRVTTMGRPPEDDPLFFAAAAAAGAVAARRLRPA